MHGNMNIKFFIWFIACAICMFPYMGTRYMSAQRTLQRSGLINQRTLHSCIMPPGACFAQRCPKWRHFMTSVNAGSGLINIMVSDGKTGFDCVCLSVRCVHAFLSLSLLIVLLRSVCRTKPQRNSLNHTESTRRCSHQGRRPRIYLHCCACRKHVRDNKYTHTILVRKPKTKYNRVILYCCIVTVCIVQIIIEETTQDT